MFPATPQSLPGDPINNWEYSGTFTKVFSKHTISAGASLVHTWVLDNCTYASATFNNLPTADPQNTSSTGSGLASYLLGRAIGCYGPAWDCRTATARQLLRGICGRCLESDLQFTVDLSVRYDYAQPLADSSG